MSTTPAYELDETGSHQLFSTFARSWHVRVEAHSQLSPSTTQRATSPRVQHCGRATQTADPDPGAGRPRRAGRRRRRLRLFLLGPAYEPARAVVRVAVAGHVRRRL